MRKARSKARPKPMVEKIWKIRVRSTYGVSLGIVATIRIKKYCPNGCIFTEKSYPAKINAMNRPGA